MLGKSKLFLTALGVVTMTTSLNAAEVTLDTSRQKELSIAVYNNDLALVKDLRSVKLNAGENDISFVDVSAQIKPETVLVQSNLFKVLEQNFNFDLLTPYSLLEKYQGKQIQVISTNPATGKEKTENAVVLSTNGGTVLKIADRIETDFKGRFVFSKIPDNLYDKPTLVLKTNAAKAGNADVLLSYLTNGMSWNADYVALLDDSEMAFSLNGWVTLTNMSGISYDNAVLQFVAGDVNVVRQVMSSMRMKNVAMADSFAVSEAAGMKEQSFMDYHLYTLARKTSIKSNQTKQLALLASPKVEVNREYKVGDLFSLYPNLRSQEYPSTNPDVFLKFVNNKRFGLGMPLPAGVFRVYKQDESGQILFVGEDQIRHTPQNEDVKIKLGSAFDITAKPKMLKFEKLSDKSYKASFEISFKNAKNTDVLISYFQNLPYGYQILSESLPSKEESANVLVWDVSIPKMAEKMLKLEIFVAQ